MRVTKMLAAAVAFSILGLTACSSEDEPTDEETSAEASPEGADEPDEAAPDDGDAAAAPVPDLEGLPDVVAEVNGQEIGRAEFVTAYESQFQQQAAQAQMSGQEIDQDALKAQTAEGLVGTTLLVQAADERGFGASDEQVAQTLQQLAEGNGLSTADELIAALGEQGLTEEEVLDQVETQVRVDQLLADEAGDLAPTRAEIQQAYDAAVAQQEQAGGGEVPPLQEVRSQVVEQVRTQKESEATLALVDELREQGDVTINL